MVLRNIIQRATDFGTFRSRENFLSFTLKILLYILPAIILGNSTDIIVKKLKENDTLGISTFNYIALQTLIIISTMYIIVIYLSNYISEFQVTVAGGYFIVLYFGIQTNYMKMIKEWMNFRQLY